MLPDVDETPAFGEEKAEKEKRGDRIIEATMKQGLPAVVGESLPFAFVQSKPPALKKEKTRPKLSVS